MLLLIRNQREEDNDHDDNKANTVLCIMPFTYFVSSQLMLNYVIMFNCRWLTTFSPLPYIKSVAVAVKSSSSSGFSPTHLLNDYNTIKNIYRTLIGFLFLYTYMSSANMAFEAI